MSPAFRIGFATMAVVAMVFALTVSPSYENLGPQSAALLKGGDPCTTIATGLGCTECVAGVACGAGSSATVYNYYSGFLWCFEAHLGVPEFCNGGAGWGPHLIIYNETYCGTINTTVPNGCVRHQNTGTVLPCEGICL